MTRRTRWLIGLGVLTLVFAMTSAAIAQDATATDNPGELEEVVVTAQKKEQDLQEVPASVVTLSDEKLDVISSTGQDIRMLAARVPSLNIESSFGRTFPRFYIRGLGNTDFDLNASQPVSLVYDGVVLENPILKGYPVFDLDRIEVLRGPQGTLFGRNTPAGIVKFESKKPTFELDGFGRVSYGLYNQTQFEGAVGGPIAEDVLAGRVSVLYQGRSDWVDNTFNNEEDALGGYTELAARGQLLYTPNDEFSALVNLHMRDLDGTARLFRANLIESGSNDVRDDFEKDKISIDGKNEQEVKEFGGVATLDYDFGQTTLTAITGFERAELFSRGDIDGGFGADFAPPQGPGVIPFPAETADAIPELTQFTEEIRLASNDWETLNWQTGLFFFREDLDIETINYDTFAPGQPQNGFVTQKQEATAWGIFGAADYAVNDQFTASAGVRFSHDEKKFTAERTESPIGGGPLAPITVEPDDDFVSWDVKGLFEANEDVNLYGRVAQSFRAPSVQGRVLFGDVVTIGDTEKILSFEGGVKSNLLENKARANVSVFYYQMDDQQLTAVGGATNFNTLLNADKTTGMGFEADVEYLPTPAVFVTMGVSYNKTEIDDPTLGIQPGGAAGLTVKDPQLEGADPGIVSIDGNSLPNAPEWILNATMRAAYPAGDRGEAFVYTDWAYRSEVSYFLYESVEFTGEPLIDGAVRVGYATYDRAYEIAAFVRNILDEDKHTGGIDFNNLTGFVGEPRIFGVEVRYGF